jgi:prolyl-tRNA editing enzyme YbaK/EbsC (Cys-tRNA(Pro) deacylase)
MSLLSSSAQKVRDSLRALGVQVVVSELPDSTRTAPEAAQAIGCQVGQIVKSLVFKTKKSHQPILALVSGSNRVEEKKLELLIRENLGKADANFVRLVTGFSIGGVPPVGHDNEISTFMDQDLLAFDIVWAAAGTPHAVFPIDPSTLARVTNARVCNLKKDDANDF